MQPDVHRYAVTLRRCSWRVLGVPWLHPFTWLTVRTSINGITDAKSRAAVLHELPPLFRGDWTLGPIARLSRTPERGELPDQDTEPPAEQESANTNDDDAQDEEGDDQDLPPDSSATS